MASQQSTAVCLSLLPAPPRGGIWCCQNPADIESVFRKKRQAPQPESCEDGGLVEAGRSQALHRN